MYSIGKLGLREILGLNWHLHDGLPLLTYIIQECLPHLPVLIFFEFWVL